MSLTSTKVTLSKLIPQSQYQNDFDNSNNIQRNHKTRNLEEEEDHPLISLLQVYTSEGYSLASDHANVQFYEISVAEDARGLCDLLNNFILQSSRQKRDVESCTRVTYQAWMILRAFLSRLKYSNHLNT